MATSSNGSPGPRPIRFDDRGGAAKATGRAHSGRRFVVAACATVLVLWGALYLAFRDWRARYRERAAFGAREVATAIDPLAAKVPPGVDPSTWSGLVRDAHALLVEVTASNLLDRTGMEALRADVADRVASARPSTAPATLVRLWRDLRARAGPALAHAPRPALMEPALAITPLEGKAPPGLGRDAWLSALDRTDALLVALSASGRLTPRERDALRDDLARRAAKTRDDDALTVLARIWDEAAAKAGPIAAEFSRPDVLPRR